MSTSTTPTPLEGRKRKKLDEFSMTKAAIYTRNAERELSPEANAKRNKTQRDNNAAKREMRRTANEDGGPEKVRTYSMTANAITLREREENKTDQEKENDKKKRKERYDAKCRKEREGLKNIQGAELEKLLADKEARVVREG
jgi:hypothetical protein